MAAKGKKKSVMEEELESISKGRTCTKEEEGDRILKIIRKHADSVSKTKMRYLDEADEQQYSIYANIGGDQLYSCECPILCVHPWPKICNPLLTGKGCMGRNL